MNSVTSLFYWTEANRALFASVLLITAELALAQGFAAKLSPPRFELQATAGTVLREVVTLYNADAKAARYSAKTADWDLARDGAVRLQTSSLAGGSCRPWTKIERREFVVARGGAKKFRFEVHVPPNATRGECRFALVFGSAPEQYADADIGTLPFPIVGQIAVVVYVSVADARPVLRFESASMDGRDGAQVPTIVIANEGDAHGRPEGTLEARDASGSVSEYIFPPTPVLPGTRREVRLIPLDEQVTSGSLRAPANLRGKLEWLGDPIEVDAMLR